MVQALQKIKEASEGLHYRSESDFPFEILYFRAPSATLQEELVSTSKTGTDTKVETVTLEQLFRNMVKFYPHASSEQEMTTL